MSDYITPNASQRIRDLEREAIERSAFIRDQAQRYAAHVGDLEREVERLREVLVSMRQEMAALSEDWCVSGTESNRIREDRADAERFRRWAVAHYPNMASEQAAIELVRVEIDADRAKEGV